MNDLDLIKLKARALGLDVIDLREPDKKPNRLTANAIIIGNKDYFSLYTVDLSIIECGVILRYDSYIICKVDNQQVYLKINTDGSLISEKCFKGNSNNTIGFPTTYIRYTRYLCFEDNLVSKLPKCVNYCENGVHFASMLRKFYNW